MEPMQTSGQPEYKIQLKLVKLVANALLMVIGLSTGAALVHGTVLEQCENKNEPFEAGVLPEGMEVPKAEDAGTEPDLQQCVGGEEVPFKAGVLPEETAPVSEPSSGLAGTPVQQPSAVGATPVQSDNQSKQPAVQQTKPAVSQSSAPAPQPKPKPEAPKKTATPAKPQAAEPVKKTTATTKTLGYDLDKLSLAVAMHETHNCKDKVGSALYNNCHGFRKNGKFMRFNSIEESHAYFKQLWARSYKAYPNLRLAKIYSGNDNPTGWLKNVNYYYNTL